jgi:hypothetical protein
MISIHIFSSASDQAIVVGDFFWRSLAKIQPEKM